MTTGMNRMVCRALGALVLGGVVAGVAAAGDLDPPAGAVMGTMKTLEEVEPRTPISSLPFTIMQSGSYYLTGTLTGVAGQHGITIDADDVALDLSGFALVGVPGSLDGIMVMAGRMNGRVMNGTVRGWGGAGMTMDDGWWLDDIAVEDVVGDGIVGGAKVCISECDVGGVGGDGLVLGKWARTESVVVTDVMGSGIVVGADAIVDNCGVNNAVVDAVRLTGDNARASGLMLTSNGTGIHALGSGCSITGSTIAASAANGILMDGPLQVVDRCTIKGSGQHGVQFAATASGCTITDSTIADSSSNGVLSIADLIYLIRCRIGSSGQGGVVLGGVGGVIEACAIEGNMGAALLADGAGCEVRDCSISADGVMDPSPGAAIVRLGDDATMAGCDIDATNCTLVGGWVLELSGSGASVLGSTLRATGVTALGIGDVGTFSTYDLVSILARDCALTTALLDVSGDAAWINDLKIVGTATTSAPAAVRCAGNAVGFNGADTYTHDLVGFDLLGSACRMSRVTVLNLPMGGTGIRLSAGANGSTIRNCRISGDGSGPYTGVDVQSMSNVVIANDISVLMGGMALNNAGGPSNLIGPVISSGNFGSGCDPCGNIVH